MSTCDSSQSESWESEISESVAFLVSAYASVRRLRTLGLGDEPVGVSVDLASQSIWTALVALDEYGMNVFEGTRTLSRSLLKFSGGHSSFRLLPDRTLRV